MKRTALFIPTLRENPGDAVIKSHQLLFRSGMIRKVGNGLFAYLPLGVRTFNKVCKIIREELEKIGAQEFKPSVVVPAELWQESGRWQTMGQELMRMENRLGQGLVLSPTAEELFTDILRNELSSYKQYPLLAYQINTKYRDEIRPRYALMRSREFTMMDAYSFHTSDKSLDDSYADFEKAYIEIFRRCGLSTIIVKADSGNMGGSGSEEFMVESDVGDDTLVLCPECRYSANVEKAESLDSINAHANPTDKPVTKVSTPHVKTIEELEQFFHLEATQFIKVVLYEVIHTENKKLDEQFKKQGSSLLAVCIRGDLEVNETKLKAHLNISELAFASDEAVEKYTNATVGFIGPFGITGCVLVFDNSVLSLHDAICGGLEKDCHLQHIEPERDLKYDYVFDVRTARDGDKCSICGATLYTKKGTELGHIFKLGHKYTASMRMTYLDENGKQGEPTMGCYGIGVDRTIAAIVEEHNDDKGIIWPMSVAPFHLTVVTISKDPTVPAQAEAFCSKLESVGLEVLLDDRKERAGVKLADSELMGIPLRLVWSDKHDGKLELTVRKTGETHLLSLDEAANFAETFVKNELSV